ncbi:MAG: hypothetical protein QM784_09010 [Polyangiaceae bacterium]
MLLANACSVTIKTDDDSGSATDESDGSTRTSASAPFECPVWDAKSEDEIKALVDKSLSVLQEQGLSVDASLLDDETRLAKVIQDVYDRANCPLTLAGAPSALTADRVNYCGKGQGSPSLFRPTVSKCMTEACKDHDACYAMCSSPLSLSCYFSATSSACDKGFFEAIDACSSSTEYRFSSTIVRIVAHLISALNPFTCDSVICPKFGTMGNGPCGLNSSSNGCATCLEAVDAGGQCRTEHCSIDPTSDLLYAATCENVGQCYGGYGYGSLAIIDPDTGATSNAAPASDTHWSVNLISGTMPQSKGNGSVWDVDESSQYVAPDAYVVMAVGSQVVSSSSIVQDSWHPVWSSSIGEPISTASVLSGIELTVKDADLVFDDAIGVCVFPNELAIFDTVLIDLKCTPASLTLAASLVEQ